MKRCCKCGLEKPLVEGFHKKKASKDGRRSQCKSCRSALEKETAASRFEAYKAANPERVKSTNRRYRRKHAKRISAYGKRWRIKTLAYESRYDREREKVLEHNASRRKRLIENGGSLTELEKSKLFDRYGNKCVACGATETLEADHIVPVSRGGSSDQANRQPLCKACNLRKGNRTVDYRPFVRIRRVTHG